jgi:hypothetical protein
MMTIRILALVAAFAAGFGAFAQSVDKLRDKGASVFAVTPVFGQIVKMSYPRGFVPAFQKTNADFYIQESVPTGENVNSWTQMITLTGKKDFATRPGVT